MDPAGRVDRGVGQGARTAAGAVAPAHAEPRSQLAEFIRHVAARTGRSFSDHAAFDRYAVEHLEEFWGLFLGWADVVREGWPEPVVTSREVETAAFFPRLRLNYAENLLRPYPGEAADAGALVAVHPGAPAERIARADLRAFVCRAAAHMRALGIGPGDRVVAVSDNNAGLIVAALAAAAVGATFASAGTDLGLDALLARFGQLHPKLLVASFTGTARTSPRRLGDRIAALADALPTITAILALDDPTGAPAASRSLAHLSDWIGDAGTEHGFRFERFPFNHPLFILFTSGTTGPPKCIVHGAGGTLIEHLKEHRLHTDLRPGERMYFHTTPTWMMWNWQLSALAAGVEIVLYDGSVSGPETLWKLVDAEQVDVFGTSPPYLQMCQDAAYEPGRSLRLSRLRAILSTGSILHDWQYRWVADSVGPVAVQSISGGTDIIGCFVLGHPELPVVVGRSQCRSLALDVRALAPPDARDGEPGELVCASPFPSRPLGLYGDDGSRFHAAYFEQHDGVWTHGDLIDFDDAGQARMHGRSDGVINLRGLRIGPAEITRALEGVPEVREALAVALHDVEQGPMIVLLTVLAEGVSLDPRLVVRIRREVARRASPLHVPDLIAAVPELPRTHSGKRSERAARDAAAGRAPAAPGALANPESLAAVARAVGDALARRRELERRPSPDRVTATGGCTEQAVRSIWESVLGVTLEPDDDFFELGGTSLQAIRVLAAIDDLLGVELAPSTLIDARTPAAMAAAIDGRASGELGRRVLMRAGKGGPIVVLHPIAGSVLQLYELVRALDTDRPVYGIQAVGLEPGVEPQTQVDQMADTYVAWLEELGLPGPYALVGYSFGALLALECARRLSARNIEVDSLVLIEPRMHHRSERWPRRVWLGSRRHLLELRARAAWRLARARDLPASGEPPTLPDRMQLVERASRQARRDYRPGALSADAIVFLCDGRQPGYFDPLPLLRRVIRGRMVIEPIDGTHDDAVSGPNVRTLASRMSDYLRPSWRSPLRAVPDA